MKKATTLVLWNMAHSLFQKTSTLPIMSVSGNDNGTLDELLDGSWDSRPWGTFEYYKDGVLADKSTGEFNKHGNDSWG